MANLTGSWLAFRLGVDPVRIDRMRKAGELYAVRSDSGEWQYPPWQFDAAGKTKPAVARFLASAREERIAPSELTAVLDRKVGLVGGKRVRDLLVARGNPGFPRGPAPSALRLGDGVGRLPPGKARLRRRRRASTRTARHSPQLD